MPYSIANAQIPTFSGLQQIQINSEGTIAQILPMTTGELAPNAIDVQGDWISLGGIDLQINGALGLAFPDLDWHHLDRLTKICEFLWTQGVDGFLPTLVTTSIDNIQRSLTILSHFLQSSCHTPHPTPHTPHPTPSSLILGVHLEGPFLNIEKRGAHPEEYLLPLTIDHVKHVLGDYAPLVKVITLAPEQDATGEVIPYLRSLGITVSLGHSQATATQAQLAFKQGASMVTHAFNAMPPLHHREPGLLGAAIANPHVFCGLIADGRHVSPLMADLLLRASHYSQGIFLVSDALSPLGLPDGTYPWDTRQITVTDGTAQLPNGTLAGTTLPLLAGVQNLVKWGICDVEEAIALATVAPRKAIGLPVMVPGQPANLLRWKWNEGTRELTWKRMERGDWGLGIGDQGSGIGDRGSGIRDRGSGIGDRGSGIGDWGLGIE